MPQELAAVGDRLPRDKADNHVTSLLKLIYWNRWGHGQFPTPSPV